MNNKQRDTSLIEDLSNYIWSCIDVRGPDDCWIWMKSKTKTGYGLIRLFKKTYVATRVVYELTYGIIGTGMYICHRCDNPSCCNPSHLFAGTQADNMQDMVIKNRSRKKRGDVLTENDVREIRKLHETGNYLLKELAEMYGGLTISMVSEIVRRRTWKWVED